MAYELFNLPPEWDAHKREGILTWQWEASNSLVKNRKISIRTGHGVGKSAFLSWAIIWFLVSKGPSKVGCTAPTSDQLYDILWKEVRKWYERACDLYPDFKDWLDIKSQRIFSIDGISFAVARTARPERPEALQGLHQENVLVVVDEASGVEDAIFEAAESTLTSPESYIILTSNPTRSYGFFFDTHHRFRDEWSTFHLSSIDCPLVDAGYHKSMLKRYGYDSPIYKIRVLGEFCADYQGIISLDLATAAVNRLVEDNPLIKPIWGLDCARYGDSSNALAKRKGRILLEPIQAWSGSSIPNTAGRVIKEYHDTPLELKPRAIVVDSIGLGGGVVDLLLEAHVPTIGCNVGEVASIKENYLRRRDELWWNAREWFEARECRIPPDDDLIAELVTPLYFYGRDGRLRVESKEELRKRRIASPDRADAFILTFYLLDRPERPEEKGRPAIPVTWL